jgi:NAD-dependent dihydropyrimidine dehydrogenase PreA subunit
MAYVIAEPCIGTKDTACVDACPVDCIHADSTADKGQPSLKMAASDATTRRLEASGVSVRIGRPDGNNTVSQNLSQVGSPWTTC